MIIAAQRSKMIGHVVHQTESPLFPSGGVMLLEGKTVLLTGAARGIGRATAHLLAAEGARLALADVDPSVEETARAVVGTGAAALAVIVDIADSAQVEVAVATVRERFGPVDVLVNNAGIVDNIAPLDKMEDAAWEKELSVNLTGAFKLIRLVVGDMAESGWGRIVNVSSIGANGIHRQAAYAATKAGLLGLTKTVTKEFAAAGVTCNAILPGMIDTENVMAMPGEIRETFIAATPAGRFGAMEEVARLIAFLASDHAGFINGAEIHIDGGLRLGTGSLASRKANR